MAHARGGNYRRNLGTETPEWKQHGSHHEVQIRVNFAHNLTVLFDLNSLFTQKKCVETGIMIIMCPTEGQTTVYTSCHTIRLDRPGPVKMTDVERYFVGKDRQTDVFSETLACSLQPSFIFYYWSLFNFIENWLNVKNESRFGEKKTQLIPIIPWNRKEKRGETKVLSWINLQDSL